MNTEITKVKNYFNLNWIAALEDDGGTQPEELRRWAKGTEEGLSKAQVTGIWRLAVNNQVTQIQRILQFQGIWTGVYYAKNVVFNPIDFR